MPIDPRIPLQAFDVQPIDPVANRARLMQLQALGDETKMRQIQMQQAQMQMDEMTRARNQQQQIRQAALGSVVTPQQSYNTGSLNVGGVTLPGHQTTVQGPAQFDQNSFVSKLNSIDPMAGMDYQSKMAAEQAARQKQQLELQKGIADILKTQGETGKLQLEQLRQRLQMTGQLGNAILRAPQNIRPRIAAQVAQFAVDNGLTPPDQLPQGMLQGQYTPETEAWVNSVVTQSMDVDKVIDNEIQAANSKETNRHNLATEANTRRGQNMVDARAREANRAAVGVPFEQLPPDQQALVHEIGKGKMAMGRMEYILARNPGLMATVAQVYPDFDSSKIKSYSDAYKSFTSGPDSKQLNAGAVAIRHLRQLKDINDQNPAEVRIPGTKAYNAFHNLLDTVADELVTFYGEPKTNEAMASKKKTLGALINRNASIEEQASAMGVKFDEMEQKWQNAAPSKAYQAPMPGITKEAREARAALDPNYAAKIRGTTSYAQTATGPNGHKIGSNDGGNTWFDVQTGKQVQ